MFKHCVICLSHVLLVILFRNDDLGRTKHTVVIGVSNKGRDLCVIGTAFIYSLKLSLGTGKTQSYFKTHIVAKERNPRLCGS